MIINCILIRYCCGSGYKDIRDFKLALKNIGIKAKIKIIGVNNPLAKQLLTKDEFNQLKTQSYLIVDGIKIKSNQWSTLPILKAENWMNKIEQKIVSGGCNGCGD